jgi:hypothetical protein
VPSLMHKPDRLCAKPNLIEGPIFALSQKIGLTINLLQVQKYEGNFIGPALRKSCRLPAQACDCCPLASPSKPASVEHDWSKRRMSAHAGLGGLTHKWRTIRLPENSAVDFTAPRPAQAQCLPGAVPLAHRAFSRHRRSSRLRLVLRWQVGPSPRSCSRGLPRSQPTAKAASVPRRGHHGIGGGRRIGT